MSLETDLLLDRRRLKRRLVFWRTASVLALALAGLASIHSSGVSLGGSRVARLVVSGVITEDRRLTKALEKLADDSQVRAVMVVIDSPGGSVAGGESLHGALVRIAAKKPVVSVMGGVAASAGYMIAVPATRIFAREATLTGSIGVLMETREISGFLGKVGVTTDAIISGPMKDQPSFVKPMSPAGRAVLQGLVTDMYDLFVAMVATGRHMTVEQVRELADGRVYTGRQALKLGLVDAIGGEKEARAWLASDKGIPETVPAEDVSTSGLAERALAGTLAPVLDGLNKLLISQSVMLDGAWAIWQRPGN